MKKIILLAVIFLTASTYANAKQKCSDLPGKKRIGKDSAEYLKCLKETKAIKLNTDSKLTDWLTGKEKIKLPNPISGLKKIGKAIKPAPLSK